MHVYHQTAGVRKSPRDGNGREPRRPGRSSSRKAPGSASLGVRPPQGPALQSPGRQPLSAGSRTLRPDTVRVHTRPTAPTGHLGPHHQLSPQPPPAGSLVASALFLHSVLLAGPVQSPPSFAMGRRAGPRLLCSLTPRSARSHALPASPALKNQPRQ